MSRRASARSDAERAQRQLQVRRCCKTVSTRPLHHRQNERPVQRGEHGGRGVSRSCRTTPFTSAVRKLSAKSLARLSRSFGVRRAMTWARSAIPKSRNSGQIGERFPKPLNLASPFSLTGISLSICSECCHSGIAATPHLHLHRNELPEDAVGSRLRV